MKAGDRCRLYFEDRPADLYYTVVATKGDLTEIESVDGSRFVTPTAHLTTEEPLPMKPENRLRWAKRRRHVVDEEFRREHGKIPGGKRRRTVLEDRALFAREAAAAAAWRR